MSFRTFRNAAIMIGAGLALTACLDVEQSFTVEGPDDAQYVMRMVMDASMAQMAQQQENGDELCEEADTVEPETLEVSTRSFTKNGQFICEQTISGPLSDFAELDLDSQSEEEDFTLTITEVSSGVYRLHSTLSMEDEEMAKDAQDPQMKQMMESMFAGRALRWEVTAADITETNGTVTDDGKTARWEVPLTEILDGKTHEFYAEFKVETSLLDDALSIFD